MKSNRFLERICRKVQRARKTHTRASKKSSKSEALGFGVADSQDGVADCQPAASWPRRLASGAFQDSTVSTRSMAAVAGFPASTSLPASLPSHDVASSAPLICVHLSGELEKNELEGSSLGERTDNPNADTSPSSFTKQASRPAEMDKESRPAEEVCVLSATDSGLYSEEEGSSEDEFLDVFSDEDEDEECLDDGWLIPAEEVSLDKVMASNNCETLYR